MKASDIRREIFYRTYLVTASEQTKKHVLVLDKRTTKTQISIENNLNRNAKPVPLMFFCKKGILQYFVIVTGKHLDQHFFIDKVACLTPAIY